MNLTEVKKSIEKQLSKPLRQGSVRNIVFWYDEEGVFADEIDGLLIESAKTIKVDNFSMFATKHYIEEVDLTNNLLVYSPNPRPANKDNLLTDTIKYSQTFSTDEASLIMLNYKLDDSLREVANVHKAFFRSNERCKKFESYKIENYTQIKFEVAVLSALCKLTAPNFDGVIKVLLIQMVENETTLIDNIKKFSCIEVLWKLIKKSYGYGFEDLSFEKLAIMLLVTHLSHSINEFMPNEWEEYVSRNTNCFVFVDNFMKNNQSIDDYNLLANFVANKLEISNKLTRGNAANWGISEILDCDTFDVFDKFIIKRICENITLDINEFESYKKTINARRNRRTYKQFENEYELLSNSCEFFILCEKYKDLSGATSEILFENYTKKYYKFDLHYRRFVDAFDNLTDNEIFLELFSKVENTYTNWFLNELSLKWCNLLDDNKKWGIAGVTPQQNFYESFVRRYIKDNERIIVIISDGLRYESATELLEVLNKEQNGTTTISNMLGVIPSYTKLGMAALLPHKQFEFTDKSDVLIDGISTMGTENREKILKTFKSESIAITYDSLMDMNPPQIKEHFKDMKLIYIYHNAIDARGDNSSTEKEVFDATNKCFKEISGLIKLLKNNVSAINFLVTSDHGYIYKRSPLAESDKTPKESESALEVKRRFIVTKDAVEIQGTQTFPMDYLKTIQNINAVIPRGTNCFKIQGSGTNYVHGGTSLQEVVIPVIKFKSDKNSNKSMSAKKVTLNIISISRKITSVVTNISFLQNEEVGEKLLATRFKVYFTDDAGNLISNENIIIADSTSDNPANRVYKEKFTLKDMPYSKSKDYFLVIEPEDEDKLVNKETQKTLYAIDLVFGGSIKF